MAGKIKGKQLLDELKDKQVPPARRRPQQSRSDTDSDCSRENLKLLFDAMDFMFFTIDSGGSILGTNAAACRRLGYPPGKLNSRSLFDIQPPSLRREAESDFAGMLSGKKKTSNIPFLKRNGKILAVETRGTVCSRRGRQVLFIISYEITAGRKTEEIRRTAEVKYQHLYESLMDAFVTTDMDGKIKEYNEVYLHMLGYDAEEIKKFTVQDLTPECWHEFQKGIIENQVLKRGYSDIYEKEYIRRDGTVFPIEARAFLLRDDRGERAGMWAIVRDITERKLTEHELEKHRDHLEILIRQRTARLEKAIDKLKQEIREREKSEYALKTHEMQLKEIQRDLEEMNTALKVMIKRVAADKEQIEQNISSNIKLTVLPYLEKLKNSGLKESQLLYCLEVESHLRKIASLFIKKLSSDYIGLSPTEIQVASLIKEGKSSKEIAKILNISVYTVTSHRYHIRKKIAMKGKLSNLRSYLLTLE
jgi:PAS domain S-box-containing protein